MSASKAFQDWPEGPRMAVRYAIDWLGGDIVGYCGEGVQVRMPGGEEYRVLSGLLRAAGLYETAAYYFPLGSEQVPDCRRHFNGKYQREGDAPGYTYSIHWFPVNTIKVAV